MRKPSTHGTVPTLGVAPWVSYSGKSWFIKVNKMGSHIERCKKYKQREYGFLSEIVVGDFSYSVTNSDCS